MATEKRLIDAIALISKARRMEATDNNGIPVDTYAVPVLAIEDAPTVDAVEVVHGRWLKNWCNNSFIGHEYAECSVCDCHMLDTNQFWNSNYCPNCGAKMDGDGDG